MKLPQKKMAADKLRCNKCEEYLPKECFSVNRRAGDRGYQYTCKVCHKYNMRSQNLRKYGLTIDTFNSLWNSCGGKCAICSKPLKLGSPSGYAVDHNHLTGEVRGLLCQLCNQGIGCLQDSPAIIENALKYLNDNGYYGPAATRGPKEAA